jgi:hypothetical protein
VITAFRLFYFFADAVLASDMARQEKVANSVWMIESAASQ